MAAGCDANCAPIHTSEIFLTAQVSSIRHRVRGYERVLVATALFATLGITGFAAPSSGDDAHITVGPIGILGIPEETAQLVASLQDPEERTSGGIRVILGKLANQSVVLCQVGFGKVNAGMAAALLIQKFSPSAVIFTGNAGALNPNYIQGDVVLATDLAEYDFGQLTNGSFAPWQTRSPISRINNPLWFHPAPWLLSAALKSVPSVQLIRADTRPEVRDPKICEGAIVTGDTSSATPPRYKNCGLTSMPTVSRWKERRSPKSAPNMEFHCWLFAVLRIGLTAPHIPTITISFGSPRRILQRS